MAEQSRLNVDVAVIGAGLSGLRAAQALADAGREVVVLEARDRVGGRLFNATMGGGVTVDLGGQWVGSDHVRVQRLAAELGVKIFPQHGEGRNLLDLGGKRRRYRGTIPRLGPRILWDVFVTRRRIDRLAREVGAEAPWAAERAAELDRETLAGWCERNVRTQVARELIGLAGRTVWGTGPEEISMLHALFYVAAAGGFDKLIDTEGGAQQDRLDGGAQLLPLGLAESLGDRVRLGAPVRRISQSDAGVSIAADGIEVEVERAIVAAPPAVVARIELDPMPAAGRPQLAERLRPGALTKCMALYEEPFWRADGLSGESVTDAGPVTLTFDSSPRDGSAGVLLGFVGGPEARELAALPSAERPRPSSLVSSASSARGRRSRSSTPNRPGPKRSGRAGGRPRTSAPAAGPRAARPCASRSAASTGRAPRPLRYGVDIWRARSRPASGSRARFWKAAARWVRVILTSPPTRTEPAWRTR